MKRTVSVLLICAILVSLFTMYAAAVDPDAPESTNASDYIAGYACALYAGTSSGTLRLNHFLIATKTVSELGVLRITVKNSSGSVVKTIWGSTSNGLLRSNDITELGSYTITGLSSGTTYYCAVTFIARDSSGSDTRVAITNSVVCP